MNQKVVLVIIAIVGIGVGLAVGVMITNSKSKAAIADLQSKMQQSEAASKQRISNYEISMNRLNNELQRTKIELENLRSSARVAEQAVIAAAENKNTAAASADNSASGNVKLYTVQNGDNLWDIAASQLGNGDRYKEILKLNPDISPDGRNLAVGTKLKIPAK